MSYPVNCESPIGNSVTAKTKITNSPLGQVASVDFQYENTTYHTSTLSSQQSVTSTTFNINRGEVSVTLNFQAASGFTPGTVNVEGWVTDQEGNNKQEFRKQIADWGN